MNYMKVFLATTILMPWWCLAAPRENVSAPRHHSERRLALINSGSPIKLYHRSEKSKYPRMDGEREADVWSERSTDVYQYPNGLTIQQMVGAEGQIDERLFLLITAHRPSPGSFHNPPTSPATIRQQDHWTLGFGAGQGTLEATIFINAKGRYEAARNGKSWDPHAEVATGAMKEFSRMILECSIPLTAISLDPQGQVEQTRWMALTSPGETETVWVELRLNPSYQRDLKTQEAKAQNSKRFEEWKQYPIIWGEMVDARSRERFRVESKRSDVSIFDPDLPASLRTTGIPVKPDRYWEDVRQELANSDAQPLINRRAYAFFETERQWLVALENTDPPSPQIIDQWTNQFYLNQWEKFEGVGNLEVLRPLAQTHWRGMTPQHRHHAAKWELKGHTLRQILVEVPTLDEFFRRIESLTKDFFGFSGQDGLLKFLNAMVTPLSMEVELLKTQRGYDALRNEVLRRFTQAHAEWGERMRMAWKKDQEETPVKIPEPPPQSTRNENQFRLDQAGFIDLAPSKNGEGLTVEGVWAMGPAEAVGFEPGEIIVQCDDLSLKNLNTPEGQLRWLRQLYQKQGIVPPEFPKDPQALLHECFTQWLAQFPKATTVAFKVLTKDTRTVTRLLRLP